MPRKQQLPGVIRCEPAPVTILAAEGEGDAKGPRKFSVTAYTGGAMKPAGFDLPLVVDLAGMTFGNSLIANLDHDRSLRVGHVTSKSKEGGRLTLSGVVSAMTPAAQEVVANADNGFPWQASIEADPQKIVEVAAGKEVTINGQQFTGPIYHVRKSVLKGFAFVSHGADDNTSAAITAAASHSTKGTDMKAEVREWFAAMAPSVDIDALSAEEVANIEANYAGQRGKKATTKPASDPFQARRLEATRQNEIRATADMFIEKRPTDVDFINSIEEMVEHAIEAKMDAKEFRLKLYEASLPGPDTVRIHRPEKGVTNRVLEAAVCQAGRLANVEQQFTDQELQLAHTRFPRGIGLNQLLLECADLNGYRGRGRDVTIDAQRAAFGMVGPTAIRAQGWSTVDIGAIISNVANKFIREGWNTVDMTLMRIAAVRPVRDFKQITTISLWGDTEFEKLGAAGEIKHGTLGEVVYSGKADTYARMLAITRQDYINDDLGALTGAPRKLGRGGALKLNDIGWAAFLAGETNGFFSATHNTPGNTGNSNFNTGVADATIGGLTATERLFLDQVGPDGKPAGIDPAIVLVPTALKATMAALLDPQSRLITGASATLPDVNVFAGKFRLESSPYLHNTAYTGYSDAAWYMLADPAVLPALEIQALFGRVEPTIDSADTDFNTLGVQMRGYADIGCSLQEFRAAVKADGGSS